MLAGDFEGGELMDSLVARYGSALEMDMYKVAHHGATTLANSQLWLTTINPIYALVSSRFADIQYHHPRCELMYRFDAMSPTVRRLEVATSPTNRPFACGYENGIKDDTWTTNSVKEGYFGTTPKDSTTIYFIYSRINSGQLSITQSIASFYECQYIQ